MRNNITLVADEVQINGYSARVLFGTQLNSSHMLPEVNGLCVKTLEMYYEDGRMVATDLFEPMNMNTCTVLEWLEDEGQDLFDAYMETV